MVHNEGSAPGNEFSPGPLVPPLSLPLFQQFHLPVNFDI